jgi:hypothetical protein
LVLRRRLLGEITVASYPATFSKFPPACESLWSIFEDCFSPSGHFGPCLRLGGEWQTQLLHFKDCSSRKRESGREFLNSCVRYRLIFEDPAAEVGFCEAPTDLGSLRIEMVVTKCFEFGFVGFLVAMAVETRFWHDVSVKSF